MPGLSLYLLNARYLFFVPSKREIACRRRRRRIFSTSRVARLKSAQKNARQKRTYKKKEDRESNCTWRFSASLFRHASRAKSARTTSSSSPSSPALDPLLRVLSAAKTKRCSARARVFCRKEKKGRQKIHTWEGRTRFLHRRSRRAIRAPPRTRGRRNRSSVRSQGSDRAFSAVFFLFLESRRRKSSSKTPKVLLWGNLSSSRRERSNRAYFLIFFFKNLFFTKIV